LSVNPQPDVRSLISQMADGLGPELIGAMCGLEGSAPLKTWMIQPPDGEIEAKLRTGHKVFKVLREAEGVDIARAWLMGMNPLLADANPLFEIGAGHGDTVLLAAWSYLEDPMLT
jgi:hypothetical protein